jgi:hypothetical protein
VVEWWSVGVWELTQQAKARSSVVAKKWRESCSSGQNEDLLGFRETGDGESLLVRSREEDPPAHLAAAVRRS